MSIAHDAPTPNPDRPPTLEEIWKILRDLRSEVARRFKDIERAEIVETINSHGERIETLETDIAELKMVAEGTQKAILINNAWCSGISHSLSDITLMLKHMTSTKTTETVVTTLAVVPVE